MLELPPWEHKKCALEEYWHADSFYFVRNDSIPITRHDVKEYIPLAASHAFQIHLRYLSEYDPLGYTLVSYFQERTIMFSDDSEEFYRKIEANYQMPGLFDGWRKHIKLDLELDHRNDRSNILVNNEEVSKTQLDLSTENARKAADYLLLCLDEILTYTDGNDEITLRLPTKSSRSDIEIYSIADELVSASNGGRDHYIKVMDELAARSIHVNASNFDMAWMNNSLRDSLFIFLGRSSHHDDIMLAGNLAKLFPLKKLSDNQASLAMESVRNHMFELAHNTRIEFLMNVLFIISVFRNISGESGKFSKASEMLFGAIQGDLVERSAGIRRYASSVILLFEILHSELLTMCPKAVDPNFD